MNIRKRLWLYLRYGSWVPLKRQGREWRVVRYRFGIAVEVDDGKYSKREAEGVAALNNDGRDLR